jgi:hypothetical protein
LGGLASNSRWATAPSNGRAASMSEASVTDSTLITSMPVRAWTAWARAGVSLPCSWIRSGFSTRAISSSSASAGSTVTATIFAGPRAGAASRAAASAVT